MRAGLLAADQDLGEFLEFAVIPIGSCGDLKGFRRLFSHSCGIVNVGAVAEKTDAIVIIVMVAAVAVIAIVYGIRFFKKKSEDSYYFDEEDEETVE